MKTQFKEEDLAPEQEPNASLFADAVRPLTAGNSIQTTPDVSHVAKRPRYLAKFKILYLFGVSLGVLAFGNLTFSGALLILQLVLWLVIGVQREDLKVIKNAYGFVLMIVFFDTFFTTPRDLVLFSFADFPVSVSTAGFFESLQSVTRFLTILITSMVVRKSMSPGEFVSGLEDLKISKNFAQVLDNILASLEGKGGAAGRGRGDGSGKNDVEGKKKNKITHTVKGILKGDFQFLTEMIQARLAEARARMVDQDWAVISAIAMIIVSLRLLKVLPGLPFAPGHKNILIIPLFVVVAALSKKRFSATYVGLLSGLINFLFGFGKYGVLGVMQFAVPGLIVDLLIPLTRFSQSIFIFALIGFCAGLSRASVEVMIALVFGMPGAFYAFLGPLLISQCTFGALSAPLSKFLFRHFLQVESVDRKVGLDVTGT